MTINENSSSSSFWQIELSPEALENINEIYRENLGNTATEHLDLENNAAGRLRTTSHFVATMKQGPLEVVSLYEKTTAAFKLKLQMRTIDVQQMIKFVENLEVELDMQSVEVFQPQEIDKWFFE